MLLTKAFEVAVHIIAMGKLLSSQDLGSRRFYVLDSYLQEQRPLVGPKIVLFLSFYLLLFSSL